MGNGDEKYATKHKRSDHKHDRDPERKSKKRHKHDDGDTDRKKRKRKDNSEKVKIVDDDPDDDMWEEKNIDMDGEQPIATDIPTAESLKLKSRATESPSDPPRPPPTRTETSLKRDEWMLMPPTAPSVPSVTSNVPTPSGEESLTEDYGEPTEGSRRLDGGIDFFSNLGSERKRKPPPERPDPDKVKISSREINPELCPGGSSETAATSQTPKKNVPGGPGFQWRMMRLRRVYETAEEEGRSVEEIALDRFGSREAFEEAKEERRILDEREGRKNERKGRGGRGRDDRERPGERRLMFTDVGGNGASSRSSSFRKPGGFEGPGASGSIPGTPRTPGTPTPGSGQTRRLRDQGGIGSSLAQSHTPIPSVMTPTPAIAQPKGKGRAMSLSSLNRLQAKVLRAKLMGSDDAETLEREYEDAVKRANEAGQTKVEVLPTLDARGRLYDVGTGTGKDAQEEEERRHGNRRKKEKVETRDPKTGDIVRINADDDQLSLGDLLRQERFGAGAADQKNLDAQFARAIATDGGFQNDIDYMDDNMEKLGRQKMRSDAMKRQFAIHDYRRTQQALATCPFCFGEDDSPPKAPVVALGTRVYLSRTINEELVPGHCLIVPIQHHLATLEGDDDVWDEVRNFMKCLIKTFAEEDKGVVFYETVISFKQQNHTFIECVPLPWDSFDEVPGYFMESIMTSETEWSQHKKLIDFSKRPGGFRRSMVPNLPYFMVQFDYKGEKGYGHVIEGTDDVKNDDEDEGIDEGAKGSGEFPRYFAGEIIGNLLELEPRKWRHPRKIDFRHNKDRIAEFKKKYDKYDWTPMIGRS